MADPRQYLDQIAAGVPFVVCANGPAAGEQFAAMRDSKKLYLGSDGDGAISYNGTDVVLEATSGAAHLQLRSGAASADQLGRTVRINSVTHTGTANDMIGFQSKPAQGAATAKNIMGCEISPRINDTIALTGAGSIIGAHIDCYLKGTTGAIAGDVRGVQIELTDDTGSSRAISGYVTHLRFRSNLSCSVTGKYSVLRVENEEGTKAMDALAQFTTGSGCLVEGAGTVGGTQNRALKVLIDSTTYYIPMHTSVS